MYQEAGRKLYPCVRLQATCCGRSRRADAGVALLERLRRAVREVDALPAHVELSARMAPRWAEGGAPRSEAAAAARALAAGAGGVE